MTDQNDHNEDDVVELEAARGDQTPFDRLESDLPPGDPVDQIDEIISRPDAVDHIKTINPHSLFRLIKQAGFDQGVDLIPYTSPRQVQIFMDLDCWNEDRLDTRRMANWLKVLVSDADDEHFHRQMREIDPEVLALFFKKNIVAVDTVDEGRVPDQMPENAQLSPDNQYALVYPDDEDMTSLLTTIVDRLYYLDQELAWSLFEAVRWELVSDMEETAYQFRTSRLEEYGYVQRTEALEVYATLDPVEFRARWEDGKLEAKPQLSPPETVDVPAVISDNIDEQFYFFSILDSIGDDDAIHRLTTELVSLANRTMVADGIEPGEIETGKEVVRRTAGLLSLGLEFVSRADDETARRAIRTIPLKKIFQVGNSITADLQNKAEDLEDRPTLSLIEGVPYSLLNPDERALFESLADVRPTFAVDRHNFELFRNQDQVDEAALRIGMVAFKQLWLFGVTDHSVENLADMVYDGPLFNEPDSVTFDVFFATALATRLLVDDPELRGLTEDELRQLPHALRDEPWGDDRLEYFEPVIGPMLVELPSETTGLATRWLDETVDWLVDELAPVTDYIGPEPYMEILLVAQPGG